MFSSRLHWSLSQNRIAKLRTAKHAAGVPVLDLTESNPTAAELAYPAEQIVGAFADPRILHYDPDPAGLRAAREAVSAYYNQRVDPDRILLTTSTSEAYGFLFKLLTDPGDEILAPRPSYPLFEFLAGMEHVKVSPYRLHYNGSAWELDFQSIVERAGERTRAIVVVNPNNPTGSFLDVAELDRLVDFCGERRIAILSDEVFADYGFGLDATRVSSLNGVTKALTFCLSGLSKISGLPQMKLGWIVTGGPEPLRREAFSRLELIADTYLSVGTPVQTAASALLAAGTQIRDEIRHRTGRNLNALKAAIPAASPLRLLNVEGGWCAILQVPSIRSEEDWVLGLLEHENVLVQPGYFYDFESGAFLVLSLLLPCEVFDQGIARLLTFIHTAERE